MTGYGEWVERSTTVVTDEMVQRAAEALTERYGRVGILSRAVVYKHPGHEGIARTVLAAALEGDRSSLDGAAASHGKERRS